MLGRSGGVTLESGPRRGQSALSHPLPFMLGILTMSGGLGGLLSLGKPPIFVKSGRSARLEVPGLTLTGLFSLSN